MTRTKECPACGEIKTTFDYIKEGTLNKGISTAGLIRTVETFTKYYTETPCKCYTCGFEWVENKTSI